MSSENRIIKYTANSMSLTYTSIFCKNLTHLTHKYNLSRDDIVTFLKSKLKKHYYINWLAGIKNLYATFANIISDMIAMMKDRFTRIFSNEECKHMINFLCTIENEINEIYPPLPPLD